jgi:hypothetical protein
MAAELLEEWSVEPISESDSLYIWVNRTILVQIGANQDEIPPQIFREHNGAMSTFWNKYYNPGEVQKRSKNPPENGIIEFNVGNVLSIPPLQVIHALDIKTQNRAHTNVIGVETKGLKSEIRIKLARIASWNIKMLLESESM